MAQVQVGDKVLDYNGIDLALVSITDETIADTVYYCEAPQGSLSSQPVWRISKATKVNGVSILQWAGDGLFNQIADNRLTLTYASVIG